MKWLIAGYYGMGNLGDYLALFLLLEQIRKMDPVCEIALLMAQKHGYAHFYQDSSVRVKYSSKE